MELQVDHELPRDIVEMMGDAKVRRINDPEHAMEWLDYKDWMIPVPVYDDGRYHCPFCTWNRVMDSKRALIHHIGKKHDIDYKLKECERDECDVKFRRSNAHDQKYCSRSCGAKDTAGIARKDVHPATIECSNPDCKEKFEVVPSRVEDHNYCSQECFHGDLGRIRR